MVFSSRYLPCLCDTRNAYMKMKYYNCKPIFMCLSYLSPCKFHISSKFSRNNRYVSDMHLTGTALSWLPHIYFFSLLFKLARNMQTTECNPIDSLFEYNFTDIKMVYGYGLLRTYLFNYYLPSLFFFCTGLSLEDKKEK